MARRRYGTYGKWERYEIKPLRQRYTKSETTEAPSKLPVDGAPARARRWGDTAPAGRQTRFQRSRHRLTRRHQRPTRR